MGEYEVVALESWGSWSEIGGLHPQSWFSVALGAMVYTMGGLWLCFQSFGFPSFYNPHWQEFSFPQASLYSCQATEGHSLGFGHSQSQHSGLPKQMDQSRYRWSQGSWSWQLWPCTYVMQEDCIHESCDQGRPRAWAGYWKWWISITDGDTFIYACWDVIKCCLFSLITDVKEYSDINFYVKIMKWRAFFFFWHGIFFLYHFLCAWIALGNRLLFEWRQGFSEPSGPRENTQADRRFGFLLADESV